MTEDIWGPTRLRHKLVQYDERMDLNLLLPGSTFERGDYMPADHPERGLDLRNIDFSRTTWRPGARLCNARARESAWDKASFSGVDLTGFQCAESDFYGTSFSSTQIVQATLGPATKFTQGSMFKGTIKQTNAQGTHWLNWIFERVNFEDVDFRHCRFENCTFCECNGTRVNGSHSVFYNCKLSGGIWQDCLFEEATNPYDLSEFHPEEERAIPFWPQTSSK